MQFVFSSTQLAYRDLITCTKDHRLGGQKLDCSETFLWDGSAMDSLTRTISKALEKQLFCLVPETEIKRVWPHAEDRERALARFANQHHWRLFSYSEQGAIFIRGQER